MERIRRMRKSKRVFGMEGNKPSSGMGTSHEGVVPRWQRMRIVILNGAMLIGRSEVRGTQGVLRAFNPATGVELEPDFGAGGDAEVNLACSLAQAAFDSYRETPVATRARFLRVIGQGILDLGDVLVDRACAETGLPRGRIEGERGRTVGQLELFASLVSEGRWIGATLDSALPDRKPLPRPDLRLRKIAIGPVAVFGASNFPLAFPLPAETPHPRWRPAVPSS